MSIELGTVVPGIGASARHRGGQFMDADIAKAIHERRRLRFFYDGGARVVEPYVYGACETHELLRAYQVSGYSRSRASGWKLFRVEEIVDIALLDERFEEPHTDYMRNDPCMEVVYAEV
jgi:predicted DNA-binding transcriptional regulator YafY